MHETTQLTIRKAFKTIPDTTESIQRLHNTTDAVETGGGCPADAREGADLGTARRRRRRNRARRDERGVRGAQDGQAVLVRGAEAEEAVEGVDLPPRPRCSRGRWTKATP